MKKMKKMIALLLTFTMVMAMGMSAMATQTGDGTGDGEPAATTPAYDYPLTVTGLATGDTVKFYQVVEWVGETTDHSDVSGWKAVSAYASVLTKEVLTSMLVGNPSANPAVAPTGMTSEIAGKLAALAPATGGEAATSIADGTATYNNAKSGMYMALVTPKDANTVYNPVFVSADYNKETGHEGTAAVTGEFADGVAKKSTLTLTKTAKDKTTVDSDDEHTTAVGDTIDFTVNTTIPGYGNVYETPHFVVKDSLTALSLKTDTVEVTTPAGLTKGNQYTVDATTSGYTITFTPAYLKTLTAATPVVIEYDAIVTSAAEYAVNEESNDVSIEYSHNPNSQSDYDVKKDTTQHYTFSIDAEGAGSGQSVTGKKTSEVVKIGVNADGTPITQTTETSAITSTETWTGPLQGAVFGLYTDSECKNAYMPKNSDGTAGTTALTATTGADGRMNFKGLDAGTYYLKEISAPAGYVTNSEVHTIVIAAETESVKVTEWWNGSAWVSTKPTSGTAKEVTYDTDVLKKYTVTIDGQPTATYTFTNEATSNSNEIKWETATLVEKPFPLTNTKGTELPSTGGIGTTMFYVIGSVLVLGAAVLLISKRRMNVR